MNMKKSFIGILAATIILSGCGTSQMAAGDPNAVLAGAAIGSNVGGATSYSPYWCVHVYCLCMHRWASNATTSLSASMEASI